MPLLRIMATVGEPRQQAHQPLKNGAGQAPRVIVDRYPRNPGG